MPTDTLYGLAVDPFNADAVARVCRLKGRRRDRALPLVAADVEQIAAQLGALPTLARLLAVAFWPGPLTLLVPAPRGARARGDRRHGTRRRARAGARGRARALRARAGRR